MARKRYEIRQEEAIGMEDELVSFSRNPIVGVQIWSSPIGDRGLYSARLEDPLISNKGKVLESLVTLGCAFKEDLPLSVGTNFDAVKDDIG